jgi:mRNA interferase RelE/StbE
MIRQWTVILHNSANKKIKSLPKLERQRIRAIINRLAEGPHPQGLDVRSLKNRPEWRLRVGSWRILFLVNDREIVINVVNVGPRGDVYK